MGNDHRNKIVFLVTVLPVISQKSKALKVAKATNNVSFLYLELTDQGSREVSHWVEAGGMKRTLDSLRALFKLHPSWPLQPSN